MNNQIVGYTRVSTQEQDLKIQKYEILDYADKNELTVTSWVQIQVSSRKSTKERLIDTLLEKLNEGDTLIVAELSRLGRSVGQIAIIVNTLVENRVRLICFKEGIKLNGSPDISTFIKFSVTTPETLCSCFFITRM